ncbi:MAG: carboxypeptidase regulatory-like domain-containing protein, partial [Myxococcales bacterium]|nr:carboxypeptidase regulatory-like domain-containing protein [Myxococcales bacterium]
MALLLVVVAAVWWFVRSPGEEAGSSDPTKSGADRPSIASLGDPQGEIASREKVLVDARATIRGTVRDPDGQPIAGAQVCARADTRELSEVETRTPTCAITREDGSYRIDGLFPVGHRVVASAPEHIPDGYEYGEGARRRWLVHLKPGQEAADIDITLKTGGVELTGVVRDISGGVLEGALVSANGIAFTDADGRFSLWVKPGSTSVEASAEGYAEGREYGVAPGHSFEIYLTPESVLVGKVVEAGSGAPVAGARIELGSWSARSAWSAPATFSEADGSFRVAGLQPGLYKPVAVTDERYGMASYEISLGLGQTSEPITVEVHPAFSVVGKVVTDDGSVCDEGSANLHDRAHNRRFNARAEPDGVVRFQGVLPGTYDVEAYCTNYLPEEEYAPLTVAASVDGLEWSVRSGQAIRGLVVDGGGAPLEDMYIMASRKTDTDPRAKGGQSWGNNTDAEGNFEVLGLKPGAYTLRLWGDYPDLDTPTEVEVVEGKDTEGVRIELPATGTVRGRILDRHGEPVADASATLKSLERGGMFFFSAGGQAQARDDGTFTIEHVKPGSYRATASQSWRQLRAPGTGDDDIQGEQVTVEAGETVDVELIVESAGETLRGQVVDRDGGPVIDAFIDATRESDSAAANAAGHRTGARWGSWGATPVLTDQDGRFELKDLSEGKYTVRAYRKGGGEAFEEGVATGSDVVLTLRDTGTITGSVTLNGGGAPEEFSLRLQDRAAGIWRSDTFFRTGGVFTFTELPAGKFEVSA